MSGRFDDLYLTVCREVGGIQGFVKSFFDFLARKTDFFYECDPGDKMGFPPGYNKKLVFNIMDQYQQQHYKKVPQKSPQQFNVKLEAYKKQQQSNSSKVEQPVQPQQKQIKPEESKPKEVPKAQPIKQEQEKKGAEVKPIINTYNGGTNDKYSWNQEIREVEVTIPIDPSITAKTIKVVIKNSSISAVTTQGAVVVEGELCEKINTEQSMWKIERTGKQAFLTLNLEKAEEKIWSTVFKGDPQIDTSKVNNTKPLDSFDDETQGAIRKIMYEQKRKQMGLPTTEEEQQLEALKQAWDAEGSPFKGQPFDPSKVNLGGSGGGFGGGMM